MSAFDSDAFDFDAFDADAPESTGVGVGIASSIYSFVPAAMSIANLGIGPRSLISGLDRLIDPVTRDYVRTANGEWVETQDSRTIMLISLSVELGASPFDPEHGTSVAAAVRSGSLTSPEFLQAETVRVGADVAAEGVLSDLVVTVRDRDGNELRDQSGRLIVKTQWRDLGSGSPIDATFTPR